MTNLTSAGQFAGIGLMAAGGAYIEMMITQFTINMRYAFMSLSLSQKVDKKFGGIYRWLLGFGMTDEIFAVAARNKVVSKSYFAGLLVLPYIGWTSGTLAGAVLGNILPNLLAGALSVSLYAMFIAIVVPEMKNFRSVTVVVSIAIALRVAFYYLPVLRDISSGFALTICAIAAAFIGAICFPIGGEDGE